jgi:hypothetical protein
LDFFKLILTAVREEPREGSGTWVKTWSNPGETPAGEVWNCSSAVEGRVPSTGQGWGSSEDSSQSFLSIFAWLYPLPSPHQEQQVDGPHILSSKTGASALAFLGQDTILKAIPWREGGRGRQGDTQSPGHLAKHPTDNR